MAVDKEAIIAYRESTPSLLTRLLYKGLMLRKDLCVFRQKCCRYLGHVIDEDDIHPTDDNGMAIKNAPVPQTVQQLRTYLGLINRLLPQFPAQHQQPRHRCMSLLALTPNGSGVRYTRMHLSSRMHCCLRLRLWRTMTLSYPSL